MTVMQQGRDFLVFPYTDVLVRARADARRKGIWSSVISLVITLVFLGVLLFVEREMVESTTVRIFSAVFIGIGLIGIGISVVLYLRARQELRGLLPGAALVVDRAGMDVAGRRVGWPEIASFTTRERRLRGPEYVITASSGERIVVGVEHCANFPATIDSAVRIFSGGRTAIDLSGIDH